MNTSLRVPPAELFPPSPCGDGPDDFPSQRHRAIWISDIHLGTPGCRGRKKIILLDFLKCHMISDTLYLVGDILDGWRLRKGHGTGRRRITTSSRRSLRKARKGSRVVVRAGQP